MNDNTIPSQEPSSFHQTRAWTPRSSKSRLVGAVAAVLTSGIVLGTVLAVFDSADSSRPMTLASTLATGGTA